MKKAIVTGANGFVGRHLVEELINKQYKVFSIVRPGRYDNLCGLNTIIIECDMSDIDSLPAMIEDADDAIFYHLAWEGSSGEKRKDYKLQLDNATYAIKAARVAKEIGCTDFVVAGSVTQLLYRDYLRQDNTTPEMVTCYAVGKMTAEAMLKCVCPHIGLNLCWCYIANFYGQDDPTRNFINFLIDSYLKLETPVLTPANQLADFMHVNDVAKALISLDGHIVGNDSIYIGYGKPRPLKEYIEIIHKKIAPQIDAGIGGKAFEGISIDYDKIDYTKLNRLTGYKPDISFEDGIDSVIDARKNRNV